MRFIKDVEKDNLYYTLDSGITYYSCGNALFNDIENCEECNDGNSCLKCQDGYTLVNNNKYCLDLKDVNNKLVYLNPSTKIYKSCSELIPLCHKCENEATCIECESNSLIEENDKCISSDSVSNNYYYLNEATSKYASCSIIDNCIKCTSENVCISCQEGFFVNKNNICERVSSNENDDEKLNTGSIIGIVVGIVVFLCIFSGVVFFLIKKLKNNKIPEIESVQKIEENVDKIADTEKVYVKSSKRTIHNDN